MLGCSSLFPSSLSRDSQDTCSDTESLSSSSGRRTGGQETPSRKISREEALGQEQQALDSRVALELAHKGSPDLTRALTESQSMTFNPMSKVVYNGILEKSYSLNQLPASPPPGSEARYPSLGGLDDQVKVAKEKMQSMSMSSQESCENCDKLKRSSSSKIKSLFKKKK